MELDFACINTETVEDVDGTRENVNASSRRNDGPGRKRVCLIPVRGVNQGGGGAAGSLLPGDEGRGRDAVLGNATNNVQRQNQPIQQARVRLTVCSQCATTPRLSG
jgi:hypothetical protein